MAMAMLCGSAALAAETEPADPCLLHAERVEVFGDIPHGLLQAIALVESGRSGLDAQQKSAWPWTVNSGAEAWYLPTKQEAVDLVRRLQADGVRSLDVGCMQVNLRYHGNAFPSLEEALDPAANVGYAASFLRQLESETGSWRLAAAYYHSRHPSRAAAYLDKLDRAWRRLKPRRERADHRFRRLDDHGRYDVMDEIRSALFRLRTATPPVRPLTVHR